MRKALRDCTPWAILLGCFVALPSAPVAAADPISPVGGQSPQGTIEDLESQGYNVQINYVMGNSDAPLALCRVLGVHNPNRSAKADKTFTTVYVDVSCPDPWQDD